MINRKFVQIHGPFAANQDLISLITTLYNTPVNYISQIGIQSRSPHLCKINGQVFEIGMTEILEIDGVQITSFSFVQDEDEYTIIDCIVN